MTTQPNGDDDGAFDKEGQAEIEGRTDRAEDTAAPDPDQPVAGPHAKPELTDPDATAGAGALPSPTPDGEADAATG